MRLKQSFSWIGPCLAAVGAGALYLHTMSPGFSFGDSGELIAGAATLGIVHPPGYSLFLLVAHVFLTLPIPGDIAWRVNLFTALCGVAAVSLLCVFLRRMLLRLPISERAVDFAALTGAFFFAVSRTWWSQCVVTEVYTLQILIVVGILLTLETKRFSAVWFLSGLSIIAHPSSILLLPLCLWSTCISVRQSRKNLSRFPLLFLLGLSPGLYVYLRGIGAPFQDWGQIVSLGDAFRHLTRERYGGFELHRLYALGWMLKRYSWSLVLEWPFVGLVLAVIGWMALRRWGTFLSDLWLAMFLLTGPVAVILMTGLLAPSQRADFGPFCLLSCLMLSCLVAVGVSWLVQRWSMPGLSMAVLALALVCLVNGPIVSQSGNIVPQAYARLLISSIPFGAVIEPIKDSTAYALDYEIAVNRTRQDLLIDRSIPGKGLVSDVRHLTQEGYSVFTDIVSDTWLFRDRMKPAGLLMQVCTEPVETISMEEVEPAKQALRGFEYSVTRRMSRSPRSMEGRVFGTHWIDWGMLLAVHDRLDEAETCYLEALDWNPNSVDAHIQLAELAIRRGNWDSASGHLVAAAGVEPFLPEVYRIRGRLKLVQQDLDGAIADWEYARRIDPEEVLSRVLLAKAYLEMGDSQNAESLLLEILQHQPSHPEALSMLRQIFGTQQFSDR
ncbi:MAG TPA: DUF2723 domain-containing protein [bacterium]|nr:DUF2723 domain-containing protein [bacterium]